MKKITLYQASIDGTYSCVLKSEYEPDFAKYLLKENADEYFESYAKARKEVLQHMTTQLNYWKDAIAQVKNQKEF